MSLSQQKDLFGGVVVAPPVKEIEKPTPLQATLQHERQEKAKMKMELPALAELAGRIITDLGADISPADSWLWLELLVDAEKISVELYAALSYIRGGGAKLIPHKDFGFAITPVIDPSGINGWPSMEVYNEERKCILPWRQEILNLVRDLAKKSKTQGGQR